MLVVFKGKRKVHFVGEVVKEKDEEADIEVKFLRKENIPRFQMVLLSQMLKIYIRFLLDL